MLNSQESPRSPGRKTTLIESQLLQIHYQVHCKDTVSAIELEFSASGDKWTVGFLSEIGDGWAPDR